MPQEQLAARLRSIRKAEGITQAELAQRSGVKIGTISSIERGYRPRMTVPQLFALVEGCGWSVADFFSARFVEELAAHRRATRERLCVRLRTDDEDMDRKALAMMRKARAGRGGHPPRLTDAAAEQIREAVALNEESQSELARQYGVTRQAIWQIVAGRTYKRTLASALSASSTQTDAAAT